MRLTRILRQGDSTGNPHTRYQLTLKVDPWTGKLYFFDYGDEPPYMRYGVASADGKLLRAVDVELPGPSRHTIWTQ